MPPSKEPEKAAASCGIGDDPQQSRSLLRSTLVIGASTFTNILVSVARTKAAALILGPAGIGLIALLQNVMNAAALVGTAGLNVSGSRAIATGIATGDSSTPRRVLLVAGFVLALFITAAMLLGQQPIVAVILEIDVPNAGFALIALGAGLSVLGSIWFALLNGYRRIGDIARTHVVSALVSAVIGIALLVLLGEQGLFWFVVASPAATAAVLAIMLCRLPLAIGHTSPGVFRHQLLALLSEGLPIMGSALMVSLAQLAARAIIQRETGIEGVGQFQAAWLISLTYVTFILNALLGDYFPRLTAKLERQENPDNLISSQQEIGLLLAGPILIMTMATAPVAILVLYSAEFGQSAAILRAQIMGDLYKVAAWPLLYALLAAGESRLFFAVEAFGLMLFLAALVLLLNGSGLEFTGFAHAAMHGAQFIVVAFLVRRRLNVVLAAAVWQRLLLLTFAMLLVYAISVWSALAAAIVGISLAIAIGTHGLIRLAELAGAAGPVGRIAGWARRVRFFARD